MFDYRLIHRPKNVCYQLEAIGSLMGGAGALLGALGGSSGSTASGTTLTGPIRPTYNVTEQALYNMILDQIYGGMGANAYQQNLLSNYLYGTPMPTATTGAGTTAPTTQQQYEQQVYESIGGPSGLLMQAAKNKYGDNWQKSFITKDDQGNPIPRRIVEGSPLWNDMWSQVQKLDPNKEYSYENFKKDFQSMIKDPVAYQKGVEDYITNMPIQQATQPSSTDYLAQAQEAVRAGNFDQGISLLNQAVGNESTTNQALSFYQEQAKKRAEQGVTPNPAKAEWANLSLEEQWLKYYESIDPTAFGMQQPQSIGTTQPGQPAGGGLAGQIMAQTPEQITAQYDILRKQGMQGIQDWQDQAMREMEQKGIVKGGSYLGSAYNKDTQAILADALRRQTELGQTLGLSEMQTQMGLPYQQLGALSPLQQYEQNYGLSSQQTYLNPAMQMLMAPWGQSQTTQTQLPGIGALPGAYLGASMAGNIQNLGSQLGWWSNNPATAFGAGTSGYNIPAVYGNWGTEGSMPGFGW